jgi:hypothetical protein
MNFKGLSDVRKIYLHGNQLTALHPRMFSHLQNFYLLNLSGNICIDKEFRSGTSMDTIEMELQSCGANYPRE